MQSYSRRNIKATGRYVDYAGAPFQMDPRSEYIRCRKRQFATIHTFSYRKLSTVSNPFTPFSSFMMAVAIRCFVLLSNFIRAHFHSIDYFFFCVNKKKNDRYMDGQRTHSVVFSFFFSSYFIFRLLSFPNCDCTYTHTRTHTLLCVWCVIFILLNFIY